jgi:hypothetical protein
MAAPSTTMKIERRFCSLYDHFAVKFAFEIFLFAFWRKRGQAPQTPGQFS